MEVEAPDRIVVRHGGREEAVVAGDLAPGDDITFHCRGTRVFVVGETSRTVWLADVERLTVRPVTELDRLDFEGGYDPGGMHRVVFHDLPDGVLVEYEIGVARLRTDGSPVWEHVHEDVTMRVRELTQAAVTLAGEERSFSISLDDGDLAR